MITPAFELHIEFEENNIAVIDHMILPFQADFPCLPEIVFATVFYQIIISVHFRFNESSLKITMDLPGGGIGGVTSFYRPGMNFILISGKKRLQVQKFKGRMDQLSFPRLR